MEKINYYVIQTEENREYSVMSDLKAHGYGGSSYHLMVPTEEIIVFIGGRKFLYRSRAMPDYILIGAPELSNKDVTSITSIKGVECVITETTTSGVCPAPLETSEVKRVIKLYNKALEFDGPVVNVLFGKYAGYKGNIVMQNGDEVVLIIDVKTKPKVKVPTWYLGTEIGE